MNDPAAAAFGGSYFTVSTDYPDPVLDDPTAANGHKPALDLVSEPTSADSDQHGAQLHTRSASDVRTLKTTWTWRDRLPQGALTLLAGREGMGKSMIWVNLAARLTRGTLSGEHYGTPTNVVVIASEDSWAHTLVPRLKAAGADLDRVVIVDGVEQGDGTGLLRLPHHWDELAHGLANIGPVGMIVIDPLVSVIGDAHDTHRDRDVRAVLRPLQAIAEAMSTTVVGVVHYGKGGGRDVGNLVLGSRGFTAAARTVLGVAQDDDDPGTAVLAVAKTNVGRLDVPGLRYRIDSAMVATDDGQTDTGLLTWIGETEGRGIDTISGLLDTEEVQSDRTIATDVLRDFLTDRGGQSTAKDCLAAVADALGRPMDKAMVFRVRRDVGVKTRKTGAGWVWELDPNA